MGQKKVIMSFPRRYDKRWPGILTSLDGKVTADVFRCEKTKNFPEMAFWLMMALQQRHSHGRTFGNRIHVARRWFYFLSERYPKVYSLRDISPAVWMSFQNWIRSKQQSGDYQRLVYATVKGAIAFLHEHRSNLINPHIQLGRWPRRAEGSNVPESEDNILSPAELSQVNSGCRQGITSILHAVEKIGLIIKAGEGRLLKGNYPSNWNDHPAVIAWIFKSVNRLGRRVIKRILNSHEGLVSKLGFESADALLQGIAPGASETIIFIIQFLVTTGANVESVLNLPISCLDEDAIPEARNQQSALHEALGDQSEGREIPLWWEKRRSSIQVVHSDPTKPFSPAWTIATYIKYSAHLREIAKKENRSFHENVFLFWREQPTKGQSVTSYSVSQGPAFNYSRWFFKHFGIRRIQLKAFRHSIHNALVQETGDLKNTARFQGHSLQTAVKNYSKGPARRTAELKLGKLVLSLQKFARGKPVQANPALEAEAIKLTGFGAIARLWISAFQNPRLIIHGDAERCARLLQMRDHLLAYRRDVGSARWDATYEALFSMIDEQILPRFTREVITKAESIISLLPKLCPIT